MRRALPTLVLVCSLGALPLAQDAGRIDLSSKTLVAAAARYVAEYERAFQFLVADETYEQVSVSPFNQILERRLLRGELFLTFLPADNEWIAVHDVATVDGEPVDDREDLRQLLQRRDTVRGLASRIAARNARFNIGSVKRNFNEPTLALLLLDAKRVADVRFDRVRMERDGEVALATLRFTERGRPTLVSGSSGPTPATGTFVIEAATGRVRSTTFMLTDRSTVVTLVTNYAPDEKLGLWVPALFTERYETTLGPMRDVITGEARYSNYRRFEVTGRIK